MLFVYYFYSDAVPYTHNDKIQRFNEIIVPKLQELGVKINDLHSVVAEDIHGNIKDCDKIHLSEKGIDLCAKAVVKAIKEFE